MKAYQTKSNNLLIETRNNVYYLWVITDETIIVDKFQRREEKLTFIEMAYSTDPNEHGPTMGNIEIIRENYQNRENYKTLNPKQLLTHSNEIIRNIVKEIINDQNI